MKRLIAVLMLFGLVAAACGSDDASVNTSFLQRVR